MSEFQAIPDLVLTLVLDFVSSLSLTLSPNLHHNEIHIKNAVPICGLSLV